MSMQQTVIFRSGGRTTWAVPAEIGALDPFHATATGQPGPRPLTDAVEIFDCAVSVEERWNGDGTTMSSSSRILSGADLAAARAGVLAGLRDGLVPALA